MLFYNHNYEFVGIDEEGLKLLNYSSLEELLGVCEDVADLFAKEPGYIHNFKSFSWIDFLLHADSDAKSAIVYGKNRTFSCTLQLKNLFLCEEPSKNGYVVEMLHMQAISGDEIKPFTPNPTASVNTTPYKMPSEPQATPKVVVPATPPLVPNLPDYTHLTPTILSEPDTLDIPISEESSFDRFVDKPIDDIYAKLALPLSDEELFGDVKAAEPERVERPMLGDIYYSSEEQGFIESLKVDKSYRFDPNVASRELGLPVDLIEEFIGDFIQQSRDFKEELFEAALKRDLNNLKILSHKLKGVAANLRIEDAFETLSIINTSNDPVEIEANLKYFYSIIDKLEGKESVTILDEPVSSEKDVVAKSVSKVATPVNDDIYEFALKDSAYDSLPVQEEDLIVSDEPVDLIVESPKEEPFVKERLTLLSEEILAVPEVSAPIESPNISEIPTIALRYDKSKIAGQLGIDSSFFDDLIEEYKHDALLAGDQITQSIGAFDTHQWKQIATQLKGISDNLRLNDISDELAILSTTNDAQEANKASKRLNALLEQL